MLNYSFLIQKAIEAKRHAFAPFSDFRVGAALVAENQKIYTGCNIECSSYSLTICAERVALFKALSEGERRFETLAIVTDSLELCPPCGACRQVLWDFAQNITIVLANEKKDFTTMKLSELLPNAFSSKYLS